MKSREEIEALKYSWVKDPIWDIETTEGFQEHVEELKEFYVQQVERWKRERAARIIGSAQLYGTTDNTILTEQLMMFEFRIKMLEEILERMRF